MKMKKRILSVFLAAAMLISPVSISASAETIIPPEDTRVVERRISSTGEQYTLVQEQSSLLRATTPVCTSSDLWTSGENSGARATGYTYVNSKETGTALYHSTTVRWESGSRVYSSDKQWGVGKVQATALVNWEIYNQDWLIEPVLYWST